MKENTVNTVQINKVNNGTLIVTDDVLAVEEPLEIRIQLGNNTPKSISITMRTPGTDIELSTGFLFTEGILAEPAQLKRSLQLDDNIVLLQLDDELPVDIKKLERNFYTTSSCGVCGKSSIDALRTVCPVNRDTDLQVAHSIINNLPGLLAEQQNVFKSTGGLHASALFDKSGNLLLLKEDVGRHNALDKLIGTAFMQNMLPLNDHILLLSGRASFELVQKAAMASIQVVAAVGAPSSLAVELAAETSMTLIGFLREERFNIYTGAHRILL